MKRTLDSLSLSSSSLWTDAYRPIHLKDFLGNAKAIKQLIQWLTPKSKSKHSHILLNGPPGVGKSLAAQLVAESLGYRILSNSVAMVSIPNRLLKGTCTPKQQKAYMNSMTDESKHLYFILMSLQNQNPLFKQSLPPVLILDDLDGMTMTLSSLLKCVDNLTCPCILICNDRYDSKIKSIGTKTLHVPFDPVPALLIEKLLKQVAQSEHLPTTLNLTTIAQQTKGDVRYALMTLQFLRLNNKKPTSAPVAAFSFKDALKQSFHQPPSTLQMNTKAKEGSGFNDVIRLFNPQNTVADLFKISQGEDGLDYGDLMFTWRIHDTFPKIENVSLEAVANATEAFSLADTDYPSSRLSQVESNIKVPWLTAGTLAQGFINPFPPLVQTMSQHKGNETHWNQLFAQLTCPQKEKKKQEKKRLFLASSMHDFVQDYGAQILDSTAKQNPALSKEDIKFVRTQTLWTNLQGEKGPLPLAYFPDFLVLPEDLV